MKNFVFHRDFDKEVLDFFELVGTFWACSRIAISEESDTSSAVLGSLKHHRERNPIVM